MEKLLSVKELADLLGLSPHTVYRLSAQRLIPVQRIRRRVLFVPSRVEAWLAHQPGTHTSSSSRRSSHSQSNQPPRGRSRQ
jgi:excisionase family DNA binding protein